MTSAILAAALLWGAGPETDELKGYHQYRQEMRDALRREATAESPGHRAEAICELAVLYAELASDPRLDTSHTLTQMRIKVWSRLTSVKRDLERQIARRPEDAASSRVGADYRQSPGEANEAAFGGGAVAGDWGPALVALIERTIVPNKWDTVGGPFTIVYYAPLRVLVVRATGEVHNDVGGALDGLRAAGP